MNAQTASAFATRLAAAEPVNIWPAPDMSILAAGRSKPPVMPTELFGETWPLISDLAEGAGAPVDYVAISVIAVAASLIGGKRRVAPFATAGQWKEPCILWCAVVGDPSSNKSRAIDAATEPLRRMEADHALHHAATLMAFEAQAERAKQERKAWEDDVKAATKERLATPPMPDDAKMPETPERRRLMVQDATPEAVGAILAGNPAGTLHLRDELAGWLMSFERYAPGGREFWLEAYGGRQHVIDRKGAKEPLRIGFNGVSVLGGIQPEKLADCLLSGSDDGLVARFLWAWPDAVPYRRPRQVADVALLDRLYRCLDALSAEYADDGSVIPTMLPLSDAAADIFEAWKQDNQTGEADAASLFKSFCGKLSGTVLRLALVAEYLRFAMIGFGGEPTSISLRSITAAADFVDSYAKPNALRVFGDAALPPVERNAAILARHLQRTRPEIVNARDLKRTSGIPVLRDLDALDAALAALTEADWIREAPSRPGAGRQRRDFIVNPAITGGAGV